MVPLLRGAATLEARVQGDLRTARRSGEIEDAEWTPVAEEDVF
jgi:hypothetical protein